MSKNTSKILSFFISIFFLYLCFKDISFKDIFKNKLDINYTYLFISIFLLFFSIFLKTKRLEYLLTQYKKLNFSTYSIPILIRHFLNATLPGNIGEIAKPYILKKYLNKSFFECLSITLIERFFDLFVISLIIGLALSFNVIGIGYSYILSYFILFFFGLLIFIIIAKSNTFFKYFPLKFIKHIRVGAKNALRDKSQIFKVSISTIILWFILVSADFFLFSSFNILNNILNLQNIILLTGLTVLAQLIPSAPSSIGVFNYLIVEALEFFFRLNNIEFDEILKAQLVAISFVVLLISILPDITLGFFVFLKESTLRIADLKKYEKN